MLKTRNGVLTGCVVLAVLILAACGAGGLSRIEQAQQEELEALQEMKQQIDAKRQELRALEEQMAAAIVAEEVVAEEVVEEEEAGEEETEEAVDQEEGIEAAVDVEAQIAGLEQEIIQLTDEFGGRLVEAINANPMIEGEELTEQQRALIRMKSDEDMVFAKEWIEEGGDYKRAIEIYTTALAIDPDNERVKEALAKAEADRYMTLDRFERVTMGMSDRQVRAIIGQANYHNIREYPERNVVAWFYPTSAAGDAAAVWFREDEDSGSLEAYQVKFEAIQAGKGDEG